MSKETYTLKEQTPQQWEHTSPGGTRLYDVSLMIDPGSTTAGYLVWTAENWEDGKRLPRFMSSIPEDWKETVWI